MKPLRAIWRIYRVVIFPLLHGLSGGGSHQGCRHQPSCSEYAVGVIEQQGFLKGGWAALRRILTCHPWAGITKEPNNGS